MPRSRNQTNMKKYSPKLLFVLTCLFGVMGHAQQNQDAIRLHPENTIFESTSSSTRHTKLLSAINAVDLAAILNGEGPFTVFAPSDIAFQKIPKDISLSLMNPDNKKQLKDILMQHIVAGNLTASKILKAMCRGNGKASFTTIKGDVLTATMDGLDILLQDSLGGSARITVADAKKRNGVIHVIDSVMLPSKG